MQVSTYPDYIFNYTESQNKLKSENAPGVIVIGSLHDPLKAFSYWPEMQRSFDNLCSLYVVAFRTSLLGGDSIGRAIKDCVSELGKRPITACILIGHGTEYGEKAHIRFGRNGLYTSDDVQKEHFDILPLQTNIILHACESFYLGKAIASKAEPRLVFCSQAGTPLQMRSTFLVTCCEKHGYGIKAYDNQGKCISVIIRREGNNLFTRPSCTTPETAAVLKKERLCWLKKEAAEGNICAKYSLARIDLQEEHRSINNRVIMDLYLSCAINNHTSAKNALAELFLQDFLKNDNADAIKKAFKWYLEAAQEGNREAKYWTAWCYHHGFGIEQSYEEAFRWYSCGTPHKDHFDKIQFALGLFYFEGKGTEKSLTKAFEKMSLAAGSNHKEALYYLGFFYEFGTGTPQSYTNAFNLYSQAVLVNKPLSEALFRLGLLYFEGKGVEQSYEKAAKWMREAAEKDHTKAQYYLSLMHEFGWGVDQSYKEAFAWYSKAALSKEASSEVFFRLSLLYLGGRGVEKSTQEALKWMNKAAELGHEKARKYVLLNLV